MLQDILRRVQTGLIKLVRWFKYFLKQHKIGLAVVLVATILFFWPILIRVNTYSEGGDAMFNAWTLSRNHHCIMRTGCPRYTDGNIYYPHKDTMLYSETQLSAGAATLPLYWVNKNPIFTYNVWTIVSFLLAGWFMYLLVKYISKGNELYAIIAGLVFEFAPYKMAAVYHLQNLSIFCLPLAILCILKFVDSNRKKYLGILLVTLIYQFYASWYQMVFAALAVGVLLAGFKLSRLINWKQFAAIAATVGLAGIVTLPLAKEYIRFSKANKAGFSITDQTLYSSSVADYFIPHSGTALGKIYTASKPYAQKEAYNLDSYSYHGVTLYVIGVGTVIYAFFLRKKSKENLRNYKQIMSFLAMGVVGLLLSFGPLLKFKGSYLYGNMNNGIKIAIPMPYLVIDKLLPQVSFIRAVGRISVLFLVFLCCALGYFALFLYRSKLSPRRRNVVSFLVCALIIFELAPLHLVTLSKNAYAYNFKIPAVYTYIKSNPDVDDIIILQAQDYPGATFDVARAEDVLWSGYHNKNIYNGYSGYTPPEYFNQLSDLVNFDQKDIAKMQKLGIRYVLVDKQLMRNKPEAVNAARQLLSQKKYEDARYILFKL